MDKYHVECIQTCHFLHSEHTLAFSNGQCVPGILISSCKSDTGASRKHRLLARFSLIWLIWTHTRDVHRDIHSVGTPVHHIASWGINSFPMSRNPALLLCAWEARSAFEFFMALLVSTPSSTGGGDDFYSECRSTIVTNGEDCIAEWAILYSLSR